MAKGWLTRSAAHLTDLLQDESTIREVYEAAASDFDERLISLDSLQLELEARLEDDAAIEEDIGQAEDFRRYARGVRALVQQKLNEIVSSQLRGSVVNSVKGKPDVKLPRLELPLFSGVLV